MAVYRSRQHRKIRGRRRAPSTLQRLTGYLRTTFQRPNR